MSNFLHIIFVVLANIVCWGMLVAGVVGFITFFGLWLQTRAKVATRTIQIPALVCHGVNASFRLRTAVLLARLYFYCASSPAKLLVRRVPPNPPRFLYYRR